jgi:hypothetical protein
MNHKNNGMAKNKTIETENSVADFLSTISDINRREDCKTIIDLLSKVSEFEPKSGEPVLLVLAFIITNTKEGTQEMHHLQDWHQGKTLLRCTWLQISMREKSYFIN